MYLTIWPHSWGHNIKKSLITLWLQGCSSSGIILSQDCRHRGYLWPGMWGTMPGQQCGGAPDTSTATHLHSHLLLTTLWATQPLLLSLSLSCSSRETWKKEHIIWGEIKRVSLSLMPCYSGYGRERERERVHARSEHILWPEENFIQTRMMDNFPRLKEIQVKCSLTWNYRKKIPRC